MVKREVDEFVLPAVPVVLLILLAFGFILWARVTRAFHTANFLPLLPPSVVPRAERLVGGRHLEAVLRFPGGNGAPVDVPVFIKRFPGKWPLENSDSGMAREIEALARIAAEAGRR
jgi:hypothetical protein